MKTLKKSTTSGVKYTIEFMNGLYWEELQTFTLIQKAVDYLESLRKAHPNHKYRFIRMEWQVVD